MTYFGVNLALPFGNREVKFFPTCPPKRTESQADILQHKSYALNKQ